MVNRLDAETPGMWPEVATELNELLSEAAVEIANLDSPENVVYRRVRDLQRRLRMFQEAGGTAGLVETEVSALADAIGAESVDLMTIATANGLGKLRLHGAIVAIGQVQQAIDPTSDLGALRIELTAAELWSLITALENREPVQAAGRQRRKFASSATALPDSAARSQRSG
jgi:hypothetical protein